MPIARFAAYLWPLRVPILGALALVLLPSIAFRTGAAPYLSGLFDPVDERALIFITALALFIAWTVTIIWRLIVAYGAARLDLPATGWTVVPVRRRVWAITGLMGVPIVRQTIVYSSSQSGHSWTWMTLWASAGALLAVVLLFVALWGADVLDRLGRQRGGKPPSGIGRAYRWLLHRASGWPSLAAGFISNTATGPVLARGHGLAFSLSVLSFLLYLAVGYSTSQIDKPILASTLGYLLLLILVALWFAGFAVFVLDRTRVPLLAWLLLLIVIVNGCGTRLWTTDHIYRTVALAAAPPARIPLTELLRGKNTSPILVATSGGGIVAGAWTARVLTGLIEEKGFRQDLRFMSGVSGGSVGLMNVLAYDRDCATVLPAPQDGDALAAVEASSLHAVGWGLVFEDLPRTFAPFFTSPFVDRGSVLEDAWRRPPSLKNYNESLLTRWRQRVRDLRCPGVVFNAMAAETGEPLLFSTLEPPASLQLFDFHKRYGAMRDVPITTAARLSATFPYVSPAARADADDSIEHYKHVVDGGYYDNYGVATLAASTNAALAALADDARPDSVLIIEICESSHCSGTSPAVPALGGASRGWPYQISAPLSALFAMRTSAQRVRNRTEFDLLRSYWAPKVCIEVVEFPYDLSDTAESWHLTGTQKGQIQSEWQKLLDRANRPDKPSASTASQGYPDSISAVRAFLVGRRCSSASIKAAR